MIIIGITGKAGSGKDTVGEILKEKHDFATTSFAWPIKKMVTGLFGFDVDKWDDREWRETEQEVWGCTPRHLAQTLGTEWGRQRISDTLWLDLALKRIEEEEFPFVAITDVRFHNEADRLREYSYGHIIHVHRADLGAESGDKINRRHASEQGIGNPNTNDFHINNFGTIEDLEEQVTQVLERILELQQEDMERAADEAIANAEVQGDADDPAGDGN